VKTNLYKIIVLEVDAEIDGEGVTATALPAAAYLAQALTPQDAVMQVGKRPRKSRRALWRTA
jgi:hypothetical protein